jgi:hypothetical protein
VGYYNQVVRLLLTGLLEFSCGSGQRLGYTAGKLNTGEPKST